MSTPDSSHSTNEPGTLDKAFGNNGVVTLDVPGATSSIVHDVINGLDDIMYACGTAHFESGSRFFITALNTMSHVETWFGDEGYVVDVFGEQNEDAFAGQLVLEGNTHLLLYGESFIAEDPFPALARFDLKGRPDPTFGKNGRGKVVIELPGPSARPAQLSQSGPSTVAGTANVLEDGKILLSHYFFRPSAPSHGVIIRLLSNGILDPEFNTSGYLPVIAPGFENGQTQIQSVTVDAKGRYVACGSVYDLTSKPVDAFFVRYSAKGKPDASFGPQGFRILRSSDNSPGGARAERLIPLEQGRFLSLGSSVHDAYVGLLLSIESDGQLNPDFNGGQPLNLQLGESSTLFKAFIRQTDTKVVVAGAIDKFSNAFTFDIMVARFDPTGVLDPDFNAGMGWTRTRLGSESAGAQAVLLRSGKIVVGGVFNLKGVVLRYHG